MARTYEEVIRIVLEAVGAQDADKLSTALEGLGDVSDEVKGQLTGLATALNAAAGNQAAIEGYRKQGEALRSIDANYRETTAAVKELDAAEKSSAAVLATKRAALDAAKKTQQSYADGTHALLGTEKQISESRKQAAASVKSLTAEVKSAERANKADAAALELQRASLARIAESRRNALEALRAQKAALQAAGVDTSKLAAEEKRLAAEADKAEGQLRELARATRESADAAEQAAQRQKAFWSALDRTKVALAASAAALYGVTRVFANAARAASDFETQLAAISTIAPASDMDALAKSVQNLTQQFGGSASTQAKALYEIIAAGVEDTASALQVLETANKLAIGGIANLETSASGLVAALNAYNLSASEAERVSDAFFVSAAAGNTTIEELAQNFGSVASLAKTTGVTIEELAGAVGVLTASGIPTSQAFTQIQSALVAVIKPSADAKETAKGLGIEFDSAALKAQGFAEFIKNVTEAAGGNESVLTKLFGRVDGLQGVLSLGSTRADAFAKTLDDMSKSAGRTQDAFDRLSDTPAQRIAKLQGAVDSVRISFGNLLTSLAPLIEGLSSLVNSFNDLPGPLKNAAIGLAAVTAAAIPLGFALKTLAPALKLLFGGFGSAAIAATGASEKVTTFAGSLGNLVRALGLAGIALGTFNLALSSADAAEDQLADSFGRTIDLATATAKSISDLRGEFDQGVFDKLIASNPAQMFEDLESQINDTRAGIQAMTAAANLLPLGPADQQKLRDYEARLLALEQVKQRLANQAGPALIAILNRIRSASADAGKEIEDNLNKAFEGLGIKSQIELRKTADEAKRLFDQIVDGAKRGKASQDDVRRAFEVYAKAQRDAVANGTIEQKALVEAQLRAKEATLILAQAQGTVGDAAENSARRSIAAWEAMRATLSAQAQSIAADLAAAMNPDTGDANAAARLKEQYAEVDGQIKALNESIDATKQGLKGAGDQGDQSGEQLQTNLKTVEKSAKDTGEAIGDMADKAGGAAAGIGQELQKIEQGVASLGAEAKAEFDSLIRTMAGSDGVIQTTGLTIAQALQRVANAAIVVTEKHMLAQAAAERQAASLEFLSQNSDEAAAAFARMGITVDDIRNGTVGVSDAMRALGNQRMDRLRPELESVADALQGIEEGARGAISELAELNKEYERSRLQREGDQAAIAEMEYQDELRRINELAQAAGAAGAAEAAEARRRAKEEHQARLREIKEEAQARRDENDGDEPSSTGGGRGGGSGGGGNSGGKGATNRIELSVSNLQRPGDGAPVELSESTLDQLAQMIMARIAEDRGTSL